MDVIKGEDFYNKIRLQMKNSSAKMALIGWRSTLLPVSSQVECTSVFAFLNGCYEIDKKKYINPIEGFMPLRLEEVIMKLPIGFEFSVNQHDIFIDLTNDVISWLLQGGIINYWKKFNETVKSNENFNEPVQLFLDDLDFGFVIWLVACGFSTVIFILEFIFEYLVVMKKKLPEIFGLVFLLRFFNSRRFL
jgi:hypothetical protein